MNIMFIIFCLLNEFFGNLIHLITHTIRPIKSHCQETMNFLINKNMTDFSWGHTERAVEVCGVINFLSVNYESYFYFHEDNSDYLRLINYDNTNNMEMEQLYRNFATVTKCSSEINLFIVTEHIPCLLFCIVFFL